MMNFQYASETPDLVTELDRVASDLRRLQALDMDATVKIMVRMLLRLVKHLRVLAAKQR